MWQDGGGTCPRFLQGSGGVCALRLPHGDVRDVDRWGQLGGGGQDSGSAHTWPEGEEKEAGSNSWGHPGLLHR